MFWKNMSGNARCEFRLFLSFHVEQGLEAQSRLKPCSVFSSTEDTHLTCTRHSAVSACCQGRSAESLLYFCRLSSTSPHRIWLPNPLASGSPFYSQNWIKRKSQLWSDHSPTPRLFFKWQCHTSGAFEITWLLNTGRLFSHELLANGGSSTLLLCHEISDYKWRMSHPHLSTFNRKWQFSSRSHLCSVPTVPEWARGKSLLEGAFPCYSPRKVKQSVNVLHTLGYFINSTFPYRKYVKPLGGGGTPTQRKQANCSHD